MQTAHFQNNQFQITTGGPDQYALQQQISQLENQVRYMQQPQQLLPPIATNTQGLQQQLLMMQQMLLMLQ